MKRTRNIIFIILTVLFLLAVVDYIRSEQISFLTCSVLTFTYLFMLSIIQFAYWLIEIVKEKIDD